MNCPGEPAEPQAPFFGPDGKLFIVEHSHSDIAWGFSIEGEAKVRNRNLEAVFKQMRKDPDFKWTIECVLFLQNWLEQHPESEPELLGYFKAGRLDCGASYTQPFEDCLYNELLARQMYAGKRWFEQKYPGLKLQTVLHQDGPLRGHQTQQIYAKAGVKYLKGSRMATPGFFHWASPDGSRLLAWFQHGYWGRPKMDEAFLAGQLGYWTQFHRDHRLPPVLGITWGHDYNDPLDAAEVLKGWNQEAAANGRPPVAYGTFADVLREVERRGGELKELKGGVPNWWVYEHWPSHTRAMQAQRTAAKLLPMAETFHAIKALLRGDFGEYPQARLNQAWTDASFACHTMVPKPTPAPDASMARKYEQAAETGRREAQAALDWIAQRVKRADEGTPVVVFNGLSWPRTGPVEVVVPEELRAEVRVLDAAGRSLSCQMLAGRRLVFVCEEVPATGYRTVFLTPGPAGESAAKPAPGEKWTEPFETEHYRATPCPGGLRSLLDKETGKEVFRTDRWRGGEWVTFCTKAMGACEGIDFAPHPEVFQDRAGNHQPDWVCVESGPVLVRWATAPIKSQHCAVKVSFTMYRRLKRVDWRVEVAGNSNEINVEQRLLFPINAPKPELAYQVPFGVVKPGTSEPFVFVNKGHFKMPAPIPAHPREVQDWVYATGDGLGITLSTSIGACAFTDFGPGANANQVVVAPILLASIGNPQRKAYLQPGDYEFFFSLSTHQAGFAHGARRGLEAQNPLWPVRPAQRAADAALPPACSFFAVQPSRAALSTIKKAEDEDALVLRLYDLEGVAGDAQVQSCFKIEAAEATDLLERGGKALPAQAQAFTVSLKAWSVETIKARARK